MMNPIKDHLLALCISTVGCACFATAAISQTTSTPNNNAMLRIVCDGTSNNAEVTINGSFKGECSVDVPVAEGNIRLRVVKQVDAARERVFEQEIRMAAGTVKRVEVELGSPQMTAKARREEDERVRQQQALAAQRAAEERRIALEREQKEAAVKAADAQAAAALQAKAGSGDVPSMLVLANNFDKSRDPESQAQAAAWYRKAAEAGSPDGMGGLGATLFNAPEGKRDDLQAMAWWKKGAAAGDPRSMTGLGVIHFTGRAGAAKSIPLMLEWYQKAIDKGHTPTMVRLGTFYANGIDGLPRDDVAAVRYFRQGAELGNADAMASLGTCYERGLGGLPQDDMQAIEWYRKATDLGSPLGMNNLASFTALGRGGVKLDQVAATAWLLKSAELGLAAGQLNLANRYKDGIGVPPSESEALRWYRKAAAQGNAQAKGYVAVLEAKGVR